MQIKQMSLGDLGTNCYILYVNQNALIIDPGGEPDKIISWLEAESIEPKAILLTHAHFDHIGAVHTLRTHYHIDVYLHAEEADWLGDPELNRSTGFLRAEVRTDPPNHLLKAEHMHLYDFEFDVIHTPGHSPGSVSFVFADHGFVVSGDVLFQRGIGRTDLPGGDLSVLVDSVRNKLYKLEDTVTVYPGHGPKTKIGDEKRLNPFVPE